MYTLIKHALSIRHGRVVLIMGLLWLGLSFQAVRAVAQSALVIGNSQYEVGQLSHSVSNALGIANALKGKGFEVVLKTNLNRRQMEEAIREFKYRLYAKKGIGLFYFSGYGKQVDGKNYLLPIDNALIKDDFDIEYGAVPLEKILKKMQSARNDLNIVMLDAAVGIPYLDPRTQNGKSGLANVDVPTGTIIGYATKPDLTTYYPGLYSKHLIKAIQTGGRIEDVLMQVHNAVKQESRGQQVPWYLASPTQVFCFGECQISTIVRDKILPTQHALVVGINQYRHTDKEYYLRGAVNDAIVIRDALRQIKVQLPDERVLLDSQATRAAFIKAWRNMVKQAKPGDTLIVTFAGHGGQKTDTAPFDESDGKDEILLFHDFKTPNQGYLKNEEFLGLFKEANEYNILFVVDAGYYEIAEIVRSSVLRPLGILRTSNKRGLELVPVPINPTLEHLTIITVHSDSLVIAETVINGKNHGALSWYFAQALTGKADGNQDGYLERFELEGFLQEKVGDYMNNLQMPKVWPRADNQSVIRLPSASR